jgi:hypothetical protein
MFEVNAATEAAHPDHPNEDQFWVGPAYGIVLDGAGVPSGTELGCQHGTAWYVQRLGAALAARIASRTNLTDILAGAITDVASQHGPGCDLDHPGTPASTVVLLRQVGATLDYLVLCDSFLIIDRKDDVEVITDARIERAAASTGEALDAEAIGTAEHRTRFSAHVDSLRTARNTQEGFWVAAADPRAAYHAVTGQRPAAEVRRALLATDGVGRLVQFGLRNWPDLLDQAEEDGPASLIHEVREAEHADPDGRCWPRGKRHDDATAVLIRAA